MLEFIYGMTHYYLEEGQIRSSKEVYQKLNKVKFWINAMHHHMPEFTGLLYLEIVLNGLNIVIDVKERAT